MEEKENKGIFARVRHYAGKIVISEVDWVGGKQHGKAVWRYDDGTLFCVGQHRDDKCVGKWTLWHENGQKGEEGEWRDGKRHGKTTLWHENGQKEGEGEFREGEEHGQWTYWHENGKKKSEGEYRDGKQHGKWTEWYEDGTPMWVMIYDNGEPGEWLGVPFLG
jgi:antitoxin component YwqK of YwqJK toxin-antitoxin module